MAGQAAVIEFAGFTFNTGPLSPICHIEGWQDGIQPELSLVAAGGRLGAVLTSVRGKEKLYTLVGQVEAPHGASHADMEGIRSQLLTGFPLGVEVPVTVTTDITRTAYVALYDTPQVPWAVEQPNRLNFTIPVVAPDPLKYGAQMSEVMGAFAGSLAYRLYDVAGFRTYDVSGFRTYVVSEGLGTYPEAAVIESPGNQMSRRVTIEVTGPLIAGDWEIVNETTGQQMWVDITVPANKTLTLDVFNRTATIDGVGVDQNVYGDWPHLAKGVNTFRLSVGTTNDVAYATVTAEPAYQ